MNPKFDHKSFLKLSECSEPLISSFFRTLLPSGVLRGLLPKRLSKQTRSLIYHTSSHIMTSSLRGQPLRQEPSESLRRVPEGKGGFRGSPPYVKRTKYYCNAEIFQAFHYWEVRAPSRYFLLRRGNHTATGHVVAPAVGCNYFRHRA